MENPIQVAILEDHPVFRTGIKMALSTACQVCLEEALGSSFLKKVGTVRPHIVVLDLILPDTSGIEVARTLKARYADGIKILVMSVDAREETMEELIAIGVEGFLSKNATQEQLLEAVRALNDGQKYFTRPEDVLEREILIAARTCRHEPLTEREYDVLVALCNGLSCSEIADQLFVAPKTIDNHKQHIFAKFGIHNVAQLVVYAVKNKIISL